MLKSTIKSLTNKVPELEASLKLNVPQLSQSMETESLDTNNHTTIQQTPPIVATDPAMKSPLRGSSW